MSSKIISAIEKLGVHDHLCLIYETREEQFAAVVPFIRIGLERGEKCVYIADDNSAAAIIDAMREGGIDVAAHVKSGALAILSKREAYLKQGYFDPDWMINFLKENTALAKTEGFPALRATGEMTWILGGDPGVDRLIEYEAKLNYFFPEYDALAICQYNKTRFKPEIIIDVMRTHPLVIYGGNVCKNFYYVPPDEFLGTEQPSREVDRLLKDIICREQAESSLKEEIAERERVHSAFLEKTRLTEAFFTHTITPMCFLDRDFNFIRVNRAYASADQKDPSDYIGHNHFEFYPSDAKQIFEKVVETKEPYTAYARPFVYADHPERGVTYWDWTIFPILDEKGEVDFLVFSLNDVTKQVMAAEGLRKSEEQLRAFFDQSINGCFFMMLDEPVRWDEAADKEKVLDYVFSHQRITQINDAMLAQYGAMRDQMMNLTPNDLFEHNISHGRDIWRRFFDAGKIHLESDERKMDGTPMWIEGEYIALYDSERRITGHFGIQREITERKRAEEELARYKEHLEELVNERTARLEAANKELEAFSYSVSHDLRAPLRAIDGFTRIILEDYAAKFDDEGKRCFGIVRNNAQKMGQLIDDLLAFSRMGRKEMMMSEISVMEIAKGAIEELKVINPGRNIQFDLKELPPAKGDRAMIHVVFMNLIGNAVKFTRPKEAAVIEIGVVKEGSESGVRGSETVKTLEKQNIYYVKDNGVGFDMNYANKLFGVFQRLHGPEEFEGTGVGLAIVQRIISRHGGTILGEGKVDEGAVFYFSLPRK